MGIKVQCELPKEILALVCGGIGTSPFDPKKKEPEKSTPETISSSTYSGVTGG